MSSGLILDLGFELTLGAPGFSGIVLKFSANKDGGHTVESADIEKYITVDISEEQTLALFNYLRQNLREGKP